MSNISIITDFKIFCENLRMSNEVVSKIQTPYHAITKRINQER